MPDRKAPPAQWSQRKTRHDPPSLEEAIIAAQGLTDRVEIQTQIAAQLMGLPEEEVRPAVLRAATQSRPRTQPVARQGVKRPVLVERRGPRPPPRPSSSLV
jgi:hypothetical protein